MLPEEQETGMKTDKKKKTRGLKNAVPLSRSNLLIFALIFAAIGGFILYKSFAAGPLIASLEAEQMMLPGGGGIINDGYASAGKAVKLASNGTATGAVNFASAVSTINIIARGDQCSGSPSMSVALDGATLTSNTSISTSSWNTYTFTPSSPVNAGGHNLSINFGNDYFYSKAKGNSGKSSTCDRNLYIDVTGFYGQSVTTPLPTVSLSASPSSVSVGDASILTWGTSNATSCTASGAWSGAQQTAGSVSTGALNQSSTFTLTCTGAGGTATASSTVVVTPATGSCPSSDCLPQGDISGWRQIFTDDFTTNVPSGANVATGGQSGYFPQAVSAKWTAYPWPWTGTPTWANYFPERTTSIHDGTMDLWMHTETIDGVTRHLVDTVEPKVNGEASPRYLSSGRYVVRYKSDNFSSYKPSWLLWPQTVDNGTGTWPAAGEIDFPEQGQFQDTSVCGFMHRQNGVDGGDQDGICTPSGSYNTTQWHTAIIEWKSGVSCKFILDGNVLANYTSRVPTSPMRWALQNGGTFDTSSPAPNSVNGHVYIDWVAVYTAN